jgi:hypothetical protein
VLFFNWRENLAMRATDSPQAATGGRASIFGWFREGTPQAQRALLAAALGWMLDAFDVMLYALVLGTLLQDFSISTCIGDSSAPDLIASGSVVLPGAIADRFIARAMIGSVLVYSVFTAMRAFTNDPPAGHIPFLLVMNGRRMTSGAVLVSKHADQHRGKAMALCKARGHWLRNCRDRRGFRLAPIRWRAAFDGACLRS